jgi:multiple sugar transport system substrate-binding protein
MRLRGSTRAAPARALALSAAVLLGAAACSGSDSGPPAGPAANGSPVATSTTGTVTFWTWVKDMDKEVALFNKKYPNITVHIVNAGQGSAEYTKLQTALKAGIGAPDVVQVEYQYLPTFTITNSLLDLAPYGANALAGTFVDWAWGQVSKDGKVYAIPQDTGPMGMLYRQDLFDKYHIGVPKTWDEFATAARKLHAADPKVYLTDLPANEPGAYVGLEWQAGARPFDVRSTDTVGIALDDPAAKKVAGYWGGLTADGSIPTDPDFTDSWYQGLASGRYAAWLTAAWGPLFLQGTAKDTVGKWRAAPLPQWSAGEQNAGNWGGSTTAVTKQTKQPAAAAAFAMFLNSDSESAKLLNNAQSLFPATKALLADSAFLGQKVPFYGGQAVNQVFSDISSTVTTNFQWSPFQDYVFSQFTDTVGGALTKKQDVTASLASWQAAVVKYAKQQGFTVP